MLFKNYRKLKFFLQDFKIMDMILETEYTWDEPNLFKSTALILNAALKKQKLRF